MRACIVWAEKRISLHVRLGRRDIGGQLLGTERMKHNSGRTFPMDASGIFSNTFQTTCALKYLQHSKRELINWV